MTQFHIRAIDALGRKCHVRDAAFDIDHEGYLLAGRNKRLVATREQHGELFAQPWGRFVWCELVPAQDPRVVKAREHAAKVTTLLANWPEEARPEELVGPLLASLNGFDFEAWINPPEPKPEPKPDPEPDPNEEWAARVGATSAKLAETLTKMQPQQRRGDRR